MVALVASTVCWQVLQGKPANEGNAPFREVTRLEPVPEPHGGLVPYRKGSLWGYADTTGRLIIAPCLRWSGRPPFFTNGFIVVPNDVLLPGQQTSGNSRVNVINARGEILRVRLHEAAILAEDGSVMCRPRRQSVGKKEIERLDWHFSNVSSNGFQEWQINVVSQEDQLPSPPNHPYNHLKYLGQGRASHAVKPSLYGRASLKKVKSSWHPKEKPCYALTDTLSNHITKHKFLSIRPYSEGLAAVSVASNLSKGEVGKERYGFVDLNGKQRIYPRFDEVSDFSQGLAIVQRRDKYGIIAKSGKVMLGLQRHALSVPDESGFVRIFVSDSSHNDESVRFVDYLAPNDFLRNIRKRFDWGGPFLNGRAWCRLNGRIGLINTNGQWVTPESYSVLVYPRRLRSYSGDAQKEMMGEVDIMDVARSLKVHNPPTLNEAESIAKPIGDLPWYVRTCRPLPDTAYLVGKRNGYYGLVARATGYETVSAKFDSVLFNSYDGIVCMQRKDTSYVLDSHTGRMLARGSYEGIDFVTPQGRFRYITSSKPNKWALLNAKGQLVTAWIPGQGFPTPEGWLLSHETHRWTLRNFVGDVYFSSTDSIAHPLWSELWSDIKRNILDDKNINGDASYWQLYQNDNHFYNKSCYVVYGSNKTHYLDKKLRIVGESDLSVDKSFIMRSGWGYNIPTLAQGSFAEYKYYNINFSGKIFSDRGVIMNAPAGTYWILDNSFDYGRAWYVYGVLPTSKGYLTKGGTKLWEE